MFINYIPSKVGQIMQKDKTQSSNDDRAKRIEGSDENWAFFSVHNSLHIVCHSRAHNPLFNHPQIYHIMSNQITKSSFALGIRIIQFNLLF